MTSAVTRMYEMGTMGLPPASSIRVSRLSNDFGCITGCGPGEVDLVGGGVGSAERAVLRKGRTRTHRREKQ